MEPSSEKFCFRLSHNHIIRALPGKLYTFFLGRHSQEILEAVQWERTWGRRILTLAFKLSFLT